MPLYEYECDACGGRFELIQKFSDPAPDACRTCGKGPVQRLASSPAIQFKGSGWYITDYARKGGSEEGSGKSSAGESTSGSAESKADTSDKKGDKGDKGEKSEKAEKADAKPEKKTEATTPSPAASAAPPSKP
jgi:putative FmdB family regulatory protein